MRGIHWAQSFVDGAYVVAIDPDTSQQVNTYPVNTATLTVGTPIPRTVPAGSSSGPIVFSGFVLQP